VLNIGTLVHAGLAAHSAGENPYDAVSAEYGKEWDRFFVAYKNAAGTEPSTDEEAEFKQQGYQAVDVVRRYFTKYGAKNPLGENFTVRAAEQTFRVPIPGTDGFLIGTLDRLIERSDGQWFVGEIKTFDRRPDYDSLVLRPQFTAYAWAASQLFGQPIAGILYDGVSRKVPRKPERLQRGGLSKAWSDSIDYMSYVAAINENNLAFAPYQDILERLMERDSGTATPFYVRYTIPITQAQIDSFVGQLQAVYHDMSDLTHVYPNFQSTCAWDCHVKDLCSAMQHQEDVDTIIQFGYTKNAGSQSFQQRHGDEQAVDADYFTSLGKE
jgi:hypothetical protein